MDLVEFIQTCCGVYPYLLKCTERFKVQFQSKYVYISAYFHDVLKQLLTYPREIAIFGSNATSRERGAPKNEL